MGNNGILFTINKIKNYTFGYKNRKYYLLFVNRFNDIKCNCIGNYYRILLFKFYEMCIIIYYVQAFFRVLDNQLDIL